MFELPSSLIETSSDDSCGVFKAVDKPEVANIIKVSPAITAKLGRKLFKPLPADQPRLRKSAILRFFGDNLVSSTPRIKNTSENEVAPIAFYGCDSNISAVSKSKSKKATLKSVVKTFNQEVNRILKENVNQNNQSVQVNKSFRKSQIRECLKLDDTTTKTLQNKVYSIRQTQTSDSLNANQKLRESLISTSIQLGFRSDPLKAFETNSIISISDISVSEISKSQSFINSLKENNVANESEKVNKEALSVSPKIDVPVSSEPVASSSPEVLSHLNVGTELNKKDGLERNVKKTVAESTMRTTPIHARLRSRTNGATLSKEKTVLPPSTSTNKRKGQASIAKNSKKRSPEIPPATSKIHSEQLDAQKKEYSKPPDEVPVLRRSTRNKTFAQKVTRPRNKTKRLDTCADVPSKESLHNQLTEASKLQLNQLEEFSPCVSVEIMQETEAQNDMAHKIDLYQFVIHRKSGFYQLPTEPITAAGAVGRPQRTRRPPKQFIQAAYIPDLPPVKRTTRFKPRKNEVKDTIRNKKRAIEELPLPLSCSPPGSNQSKKKSSSIKGSSSKTKKPAPLEEVKEKSLPKRRAAKRLEYESGSKKNDGVPVLLEEPNDVHMFFDKSQVCISDNTISGVQRLSVNENKEEEDTYISCLIDNKSTNVKCCSAMPLLEADNGKAIEAVCSMVNQSQNGKSVIMGHMKILPRKKLLVEVNKHLWVSYVVIRGSGVAKIGSKEVTVKHGSVLYIPLGVSYFIYNNGSLPLVLQFTINSKL